MPGLHLDGAGKTDGADAAEAAQALGSLAAPEAERWVQQLRAWAQALGFSQIGIAGIDLSTAEPGLLRWLEQGFHGGMDYMARHGLKRARPAELVPGTVSVVSVAMDYLPRELAAPSAVEPTAADATAAAATHSDWRARELAALRHPGQAVVSVYARGRDYHKVMRARLQQLADRLQAAVGPCGHRVFVDSAPVLEVELASRSGLGWRGKHTLALSREGGSMFFLGELFVDLALPNTAPVAAHCGRCQACITACPTAAIVAPYRLDARRCISYLTIEHEGAIDEALRPLMGNRIYGCDDCQLVCPWNKFARRSALPDFDERQGLGSASLCTLWGWDEAEFLRRTEGSAIRRIGHARWRRNLAVAMGNAWREQGDEAVARALAAAFAAASPLLREHMAWALGQRARPVAAGSAGAAPATP